MKEKGFIQTVWAYYHKHKRKMPWREDTSSYSVFLSEIMLQQTQVARVLVKYPIFIHTFPDFHSLSRAQPPALLSTWQGMGYNRRALYLKSAAHIVCEKYDGILPDDPELLDELPGIGHATANSIVAFAFNKPVIFIETNIRRVYIHHFFADTEAVSDESIIPYISSTLDKENPREWYWALMDYGAYLSTQIDNPNKKSKHYTKQKKFIGSVREVRGGLIKLLLKKQFTLSELKRRYTDERLIAALIQLEKEGFIREKDGVYTIK